MYTEETESAGKEPLFGTSDREIYKSVCIYTYIYIHHRSHHFYIRVFITTFSVSFSHYRVCLNTKLTSGNVRVRIKYYSLQLKWNL
jgi:hypothetical protein